MREMDGSRARQVEPSPARPRLPDLAFPSRISAGPGASRLLGVLLMLPLLLALPALPAGATPCENESGFTYHRYWRAGGALASPVNLLGEGTSFETGESGGGLLDGVIVTQRQFKENLGDRNAIRRAFTGFTFDSLPGNFVDGTRSLRIDYSGPWYKPGFRAGNVDLSFDWFRVPAEGVYDISFWTKVENHSMAVYAALYGLDTLRSEWTQQIDLDGHPGGPLHATFWLDPRNGWVRQHVRTPVLSPSRRYSISLYTGSSTLLQWCVQEGTILRLDAVQVSAVAPAPADTLQAYDPHSHGEDLFLSVRRRYDEDASWNNVFFSGGDGGPITGRMEVYQDRRYATRGAGTVFWSLYALYPGAGDGPIASGSAPVSFGSSPRQFVEVDLSSAAGSRLGVYKWIAEFAGGDGIRSDRQELSYALVRSRALAAGVPGNFGVDLGVAGITADSTLGSAHHAYVEGRAPLEDIMSLYSGLSFTQDRVYGIYDWTCTHWAPGVEDWNGFYPELAEEYGLAQIPVISVRPAWWKTYEWTSWERFVRDAVRKYGATMPDSGAGVLTWSLFNEVNRNETPTIPLDVYAGLLVHAADIIHATVPRSEMITTLHSRDVTSYVQDLLSYRLPDGRRVGNSLDGVAMNAYLETDTLSETPWAPEQECFAPGVPWGTWQLQCTRYGAQLVDAEEQSAVRHFPLTETGVSIGSLRADRPSETVVWTRTGGHDKFLDTVSGSLVKARAGVEHFIRYQLLNLAIGGGPICLFAPEPNREFATVNQFGLFHPDHSPTALLAAQAELNAEIGPATYLRAVPPTDLLTGSGQPNTNTDVRLLVFDDHAAGKYVLVGWSAGSPATIRFNISSQTWHASATDIQGNRLPLAAGISSFSQKLTSAPCYIRLDDTMPATDLFTAIDHVSPPSPVVEGWSTTDSTISVSFRFRNPPDSPMAFVPGDVDSLYFYWKPDGSAQWTLGRRIPVWAHPDSIRYKGTILCPPGGVFWARVSAVEAVTRRESFSLPVQIANMRGRDTGAVVVHYRDEFTVAGPNPARGSVRLSGTVAAAGRLGVELFDVSGRRVRTMEQLVARPGPFELVWDGRDGAGHPLPAGIYFLDLARDGNSLGRKRVVLMK